MKIKLTWHSNKQKRKAKRSTHKPKIDWQKWGFTEAEENPPISIEEIRRQVIAISGRGMEPGTRSRSAKQETTGHGVSHQQGRKRRRGATE